jgi:hypothetical protein
VQMFFLASMTEVMFVVTLMQLSLMKLNSKLAVNRLSPVLPIMLELNIAISTQLT